MTAPVSPPQPTADPVRQSAPLWELHKQDDYADHEFSFWFDGEIVVLANPAFGRVAVLKEMVDGLNSHASLKARAEQAEQSVSILESNAREQAKLLADTGRRVEDLETALLAAREYVAGASLAAGTPAYIRCCELLIKIDAALPHVRGLARGSRDG